MTETDLYSPRWGLIRWLTATRADVPLSIQIPLVKSLYGSLPIFLGGLLNTLAVSIIAYARVPSTSFLIWIGMEVALGAVRLPVLVRGRKAIANGTAAPTDLYLLLGLFWAASVGYGAFVSMMSGDWILAMLASFSAAGMVGGICIRNFGAPRLVGAMIVLSLGPCCIAAALSGQPSLSLMTYQIPVYLVTMSAAAFQLNRMFVTRMQTQEALEESARKALWMASHDTLTGLPNRAVLQDRLDDMVQDKAPFALLLLDVDNFKSVNDTVGHDAGDALLCAFSDRIGRATSADDLVVRLGGDEFAVILTSANSEADLERAADMIFAELRLPFIQDQRVLECNASIGASFYPRDADTRSDLMKNADIALYAAKAAGRGNLKLYRGMMRNEIQRRNSMLALARDALNQDGIAPFYQPKVDLRTKRISGFEALLRWRLGSAEHQLPRHISAAFDDPMLAAALSDRIIDQVMRDARRWLDDGVDFGHVSINASAAEFRRPDFAEAFLERLRKYSVPPHCVQLEVTETVFLGGGIGYVAQALTALSGEGIMIALDDFGTGFASLSHLKQFPVDILKVDTSFVRDIGRDSEAEAIVRAVVNLGHSLNMQIVAEGVESVEQEARLMALGCDFGQGFLYAKAIAGSDVTWMIQMQDTTVRGAV